MPRLCKAGKPNTGFFFMKTIGNYGKHHGCGRSNSGSNPGILPNIVHKVKTRDGVRDPGEKREGMVPAKKFYGIACKVFMSLTKKQVPVLSIAEPVLIRSAPLFASEALVKINNCRLRLQTKKSYARGHSGSAALRVLSILSTDELYLMRSRPKMVTLMLFPIRIPVKYL